MCMIEGCENPVHAKRLCQNHYKQADRLSRGLKKPGPAPDPSRPRSRYADRPERARRGRPLKTHCVHGHEYTEENTYVSPAGVRACKRCRNNNVARQREKQSGVGQGGMNLAKTHCPRDHPYDEENTVYTKDGRRQCRACARINMTIQNVKRYGITVEDVSNRLEAQDEKCLVCSRKFGEVGVVPHIDHDHSCCGGDFSCGKCVRGLLCNHCNRGLGSFHDSPDLLRAAAAYIESR